jgi:hypothetical protein
MAKGGFEMRPGWRRRLTMIVARAEASNRGRLPVAAWPRGRVVG